MDRREAILAQLFTVATAISDFTAVYRNRPMTPDRNLRPACFILDAHETALQIDEPPHARRGLNLVALRPEIYISLGAAPEDVGTTLNTLRIELLQAIFADPTLASLVTANGDIRYEGAATALTMGAGVEGEMGLSLAFLYPLKPAEF
jgi:hypothetical protein